MRKTKVTKLESLKKADTRSGLKVATRDFLSSTTAEALASFGKPSLKVIHGASEPAKPQYRTNTGKWLGRYCDEIDRQINEIMRL